LKISFHPEHLHAKIFADAKFAAVVDACAGDARALRFLTRSINNFHSHAEAVAPLGAIAFATLFAREPPEASASASQTFERIAGWLIDLYSAHDPAHVRGCFLEGLVKKALHPRYGNAELHDNVVIKIENGREFTSPSVDVAGWDGATGECHDCKTLSAYLDVSLVQDLDDGLPFSSFRIGIVTTDSKTTTLAFLRGKYRLSSRTKVIPIDELWAKVPLQRAA
jgi:hypothetical protein